ncbi:hypothetical protein MKUB_08450 [Mycobacterium kubicae]|uniref:Transmembrane protein n=1 Tax=Mycobacterium kubicae TaxID=120959 RepID=A0AAX1JBF4_9MYCO|nr:hypothetical protein [Mycobacterium kubicae]MCV7094960.1 hypothetical protein [Mycobacterium kubicae]OBK55020.1 hypothetical protein A5657_12015 [Mycobacterium kubicae]ORV96995.1 hypothetical protein AWC13_17060 [Mycobacterium kubicae]QNI10585.1 hypothetical protein GAN18_04615 [Mycobacterium kubicae]QPI38796.1 hypothetical protein I2456_04535 [Mycobacterium kubicae]
MNDWFNYEATLKILLFSLLAGAALPAMFAAGVRFQAAGAGDAHADGAAPQRNPLLLAIAWTIYAIVLAVIVLGVLYIARDFIAHHTGWAFLGAKPK